MSVHVVFKVIGLAVNLLCAEVICHCTASFHSGQMPVMHLQSTLLSEPKRDHAFVQRDQICSKGVRTGITLTLPAEIGDEYCGNEYITHARTSAPKPRSARAIAVLLHASPIMKCYSKTAGIFCFFLSVS